MTDDQIKDLALQLAREAGATQVGELVYYRDQAVTSFAERFARICVAHGLEMANEKVSFHLPYVVHARTASDRRVSANTMLSALLDMAAEVRK